MASPAATSRVLHLEGADQRQLHFIGLAGMRDGDDLREAVDLAVGELDVVACSPTVITLRPRFLAASITWPA